MPADGGEDEGPERIGAGLLLCAIVGTRNRTSRVAPSAPRGTMITGRPPFTFEGWKSWFSFALGNAGIERAAASETDG